MHTLDIFRLLDEGQEFGTFSRWTLDGKPLGVGVERPWKNNSDNISCVPAGNYTATLYNSPTHGRVYQFNDVPERENIQIHSANFARELKGCLAPGREIAIFPGSEKGVTQSRDALKEFMARCEGDRTIEVIIHAAA